MADRVVVQKNKAGGRLLNSVKGVFIGIATVFICSILLVCNEASSVKNYRAFVEAGKTATKVIDAQLLPENNGKLVALEGGTLTFTPVSDGFYGVEANSFRLDRKVEFYQRTETKKGSSTDAEVTYTYSNDWSSTRIDSSKFFDASEKNANNAVPTGIQYDSGSVIANDVKLGDFTLTTSQAGQISASTSLTPSSTTAVGFKVSGNYIVNTDQGSAPKVGDVRISYSYSSATTASALAQQNGNNLLAYTTKNGTEINKVFGGMLTREQMTAQMQAANKAATWIFRILLAIFICTGFSMFLKPVQVLVSLIPFIGKPLSKVGEKIAGIIGGIVGVVLSLVIIAISWIAVRPLIGIPLLIIAVGLIILASKYGKKKDGAPAPTPDPAPAS